jgi:hypothetical protein
MSKIFLATSMAVAEKRREEDDKRTRGRQGEKRTRK